MNYDTWKATDTAGDDADRRPTEEDEVRDHIDTLMQTAVTAEQWMEICRLAESIGDTSPMVIRDVSASTSRPSWWQCHFAGHVRFGYGASEAEAIADLLEQESDK